MKIAIASYGFSHWGGGIDFVRHIASSVASATEDQPRINKSLILPTDDLSVKVKNALYPIREILKQVVKGEALNWVERPRFSESYLKKNFSDFESSFVTLSGGSTLISQMIAAKKSSADVVLPCMDVINSRISLPWVGYIYDFQHRYIPELFTPKEVERRNKSFELMLNNARHIIVNAKSVVHDAENFHSGFSAKVHALPFSPCPQKSWLENELDVRSDYGIDRPYFMVSNQFWKHKDHPTAFRAFARYIQSGGDALLVCTGQTSDWRFPDYFKEIVSLISRLNLSSRVKILGHISKKDQISLMKSALAVVQPTLFEGGPGGGASYDAISLGIPVIASDIPVNLEMDCGDITFFPAGNDDALAKALYVRASKVHNRPGNDFLWESGLKRSKRCGQFILSVAEQALNDSCQDTKQHDPLRLLPDPPASTAAGRSALPPRRAPR